MKFGQRLELGGRRPLMRLESAGAIKKRQTVSMVLALAFVAAIAIGWRMGSKQHTAVTQTNSEQPMNTEQRGETEVQPELKVEVEHRPIPEEPPEAQEQEKETAATSARAAAIDQPQVETTGRGGVVPGETSLQPFTTTETTTAVTHEINGANTVDQVAELLKGGRGGGGEGGDEEKPRPPPTTEAMVKFFSNVLLVVSFDSNRMRLANTVVPILKQLYGRIFTKMTFVATGEVEGHRVEQAPTRPTMQTDHGLSLNYGKLTDMPNQFLGIEGILWIDCDTILNYWNFVDADKTLIWYPHMDLSKFSLVKPDTNDDWLEEEHWRNKLKETLDSLDQNTKDTLRTNLAELGKSLWIENPGEIVAARGPFQIFYVPSKHFRGMQRLLDVMYKQGIPAEIAIPTMIFGLDSPKNWDKILEDSQNLLNVHSLGHLHMCLTVYKPKYPAFWPWPYKPEGSIQELLGRMVQGDPGIQPLLDSLPKVPSQDEIAKQPPKGPLVNVVLVLSYDHPDQAKLTEKLYRTVYGMTFKDIIYVANQPVPEDARKDAPPLPDTTSLTYGYVSLALDMKDIDGMLFLSADTVFNHWTAEDADKDKIWIPGLQTRDSAGNPIWSESAQWGTGHWGTIDKWKAQIEKAVGLFPDDAKEILKESFAQMEKALPTLHTGSTPLAAKGPSHLFYIPTRLLPRYKALAEILMNNFVPGEVAIPTICLALENPSAWDPVFDTFVEIAEGDERPPLTVATSLYDIKSAGIRPWPFEVPKSQKALFHKMSRGDPDLETYVRNWDF